MLFIIFTKFMGHGKVNGNFRSPSFILNDVPNLIVSKQISALLVFRYYAKGEEGGNGRERIRILSAL